MLSLKLSVFGLKTSHCLWKFSVHRASLYILLFSDDACFRRLASMMLRRSTGCYLEEGTSRRMPPCSNQAMWLVLAVVAASVLAFVNPREVV